MALTADQVQKFYIGYYARPADPVGLTYWQTQDEAAALKGFSGSDEFTKQFTGLSASQQVTKVYNNLLGRAPDAAGLLYWAGELTAGRETIGTLVLSMTKNALGKDVTTIEDRVSYSKSFTAALDTPAEINAYAGTVATQTARDALLKVVANSVGDHTALTAEVKNIDATVATIVAGGGSSNSGQALTLTAGTDYADTSGFSLNGGTFSNVGFKFTSANEVITATNASLAATGPATDILVDGSTTDSDVMNIALAATQAAQPVVTNIENINITATNAAPATLDFTGYTGVKSIKVAGAPTGTVGLLVVTNTGATTVDARGVTSAAGGVTADFSASTSTANLTLLGGAGADNLIGGLGNDTISGGNGGTAATGLVGGAGNDTITGGTGIDVIDGGSGNDVITGGGGGDVINVGSGNDTVKFEATAVANGTDLINGFALGAASADVLDVSAFLGAAAVIATVGIADGVNNVTDANVVVINGTYATATAGGGESIVFKASTKYVIIEAAVNGQAAGSNANMYYVTTDGAGAVAAVGAAQQVATLVGVSTAAGGVVGVAAGDIFGG